METIFHEAADLAPAERAAFLDRACGNDRELRNELESLLAADRPDNNPEHDFLRDPVLAAVAEAAEGIPGERDRDSDLAGQRIGPYLVTGLIGKGGMGAVYHAVRADGFHMEVAIKLLKRGTDTDAALSRFRVERQILADLQHPNIARLLDGGSAQNGLPYFVMEYVDGAPLLKYAACLSIRQRLELFRQITSAVQYAHEKRIVHRDIKPSNILVTPEGIAKLLDFGIAKLVDPEQEITLTATGFRPMTPGYASPEQVMGLPVTPATDVYALGAVLYELLTGERAQQVDTWSPVEIQHRICACEPKTPSAIAPQLDPDLDSIVMMALRKEPERRYTSVQAFSDNIERYLQHLPVEARRGRLPYRARKFFRRNRSTVLIASLAGALAFPVSFTLSRARNAGFAPDLASIAVLPFANAGPDKNLEYLAEGIGDELLSAMAKTPGLRVAGAISSSRFRNAGDLRAAGQKLRVANLIEGSVFKQGDHIRLSVRMIKAADGFVAWSNTYEIDINTVVNTEQQIANSIRAALNLNATSSPAQSVNPNPNAYNAYLQGSWFRQQGNMQKAIEYFEEAIRFDPRYAPAWVGLGDTHSMLAGSGSSFIPVEEGYRKARQEIEKALALDPALPEAHASLALIKMLHDRDWSGANASIQRALALTPGDAGVLRVAGLLARSLGQLDRSISIYRRAVDLDPIYSNGYKNLGISLYYAGRLNEAASAIRKALELNPNIGYAHAYLGLIDLAESRPLEAIAEGEKEKGGYRLLVLALGYYGAGRKAESDAALAELIAKLQEDFPCQIAGAYAFRGETGPAFEWLNRALRGRNDCLGEIKADPLLRNIRSDPRYPALLRKIGLPLT